METKKNKLNYYIALSNISILEQIITIFIHNPCRD